MKNIPLIVMAVAATMLIDLKQAQGSPRHTPYSPYSGQNNVHPAATSNPSYQTSQSSPAATPVISTPSVTTGASVTPVTANSSTASTTTVTPVISTPSVTDTSISDKDEKKLNKINKTLTEISSKLNQIIELMQSSQKTNPPNSQTDTKEPTLA